MNEKRTITDEEKIQLAKLFKGLIPNGTLDEDDILWIMNEVENGNRDISFEDFMKAKQERHDKFAAKKSEDPHFCFKCKHQACKPDEEPCKNCSEWPHPGYSTMASKWEPKEETKQENKGNHNTCKTCNYYDIPHCVDNTDFPCGSCVDYNKWTAKEPNEEATGAHFCKDCKFAENPVFKEPCDSCFVWDRDRAFYHKNWQPKVEDARLCTDCKFAETPIFEEPCSSCLKSEDKSKNWQPKDQEEKKTDMNYPEFEDIIDRLKSLDRITFGMKIDTDNEFKRTRSALDHIRERFEEYEKQQKDILKKLNNIELRLDSTFAGFNYRDIFKRLDNIEQVVMKNSVGINTTYEKASAVHDEVCKDEDICKDCNYYGMCSGYKGDMIYCKNFKKKDISSAKEPPKFKVGDIVKVTNDSKNKDFFVCRIKWSEHSKTWNYLISLDLEDISGAFWRTEKWLTKSEDHSEPLFKVGDKVKLKSGNTVYTVLSVGYFICGERKVYRYRISHSETTPHYENENRLVKA